MDSKEYFNQKTPSWLEPNPKSSEEINREFLTQLCYDGDMEDDEIDEFVDAIIDWKNKQSDEFYLAKINMNKK